MTASWGDVGFCWLAMAFHALLCYRVDPSLSRDWFISALRAGLQLFALSFVLVFLFKDANALWVPVALTVMLLTSAYTAAARTGVKRSALIADCLTGLLVSTLLVMVPLMLWYGDRRFFSGPVVIPFVGILLGNSLSGLCLGVAQWERELKQRRPEIEYWVSLGATPREATRDLEASVLRTAMTVVINAMAVSGIVSIPGQVTGQLLAGGSPVEAVKVQLMLLFLMSCVIFASTWIVLRLGVRRHFDSFGAMRPLIVGGAT